MIEDAVVLGFLVVMVLRKVAIEDGWTLRWWIEAYKGKEENTP